MAQLLSNTRIYGFASTDGQLSVANVTSFTSISNTTGSLIVTGGVGISGNVNVSNTINILSLGTENRPLTIQGGQSGVIGARIGANEALDFYNSGFPYYFATGGARTTLQFALTHTASAVNYLQITGNTTGGSPILSAQGSDTNVGINLLPKGNGSANIVSTANSTSNTSGALVVRGGMGITGNVFMSAANNFSATSSQNSYRLGWTDNYFMRSFLFNGMIFQGNYFTLDAPAYLESNRSLFIRGTINGNDATNNVVVFAGSSPVLIQNTATSTSTSTGALVVGGGVGVTGNVYVQGPLFRDTVLSVRGAAAAANLVLDGFSASNFRITSSSFATIYTTGTTVDANLVGSQATTLNVGSQQSTSNVQIYAGTTGSASLKIFGNTGPAYANIGSTTGVGSQVNIISSLPSTSNTSGALIVSGGVGVSGNIYVGGTNAGVNGIYTDVLRYAANGQPWVMGGGGGGGGGGASPSGYLANTVLVANSSGFISNSTVFFTSSNNQFIIPTGLLLNSGAGISLDASKTNTEYLNISPNQLQLYSSNSNISVILYSGGLSVSTNDYLKQLSISADTFLVYDPSTAGGGFGNPLTGRLNPGSLLLGNTTSNVAVTNTSISFNNRATLTTNTSNSTIIATDLTPVVIQNTTPSTSNTTGALTVAGGVGISGNTFLNNSLAAVTTTTSAVNYLQVTGNTTGNPAILSAQGSGADVSMNLVSKGAGTINFIAQGTPVVTMASGSSPFASIASPFIFSPTIPGAWGSKLTLPGDSTNATIQTPDSSSIRFGTFGGTGVSFYTGNTQFNITHTGSAVNYLQVTGNTTGGSPILSAQGNDTNIGINLLPKGNGSVNITSNTISTTSTTGALVVYGGVGVSGNVHIQSPLFRDTVLRVGHGSASANLDLITSGIGATNFRISSSSFATIYTTGTTVDANLVGFQATTLNVGSQFSTSNVQIYTGTTGSASLKIYGAGTGPAYANIGSTTGVGSQVNIISSLPSTSNSTGALVVSGGVGVTGNIYVGGTSAGSTGVYTDILRYSANGQPWSFGGGGGSITITNDTTNSTTLFPLLSTANSGTLSTANTSNTKLYYVPSTGTLNATVFNSLSDAEYKENIIKITNAVNTINQIDGVSFSWKENGLKSYGVIAQDIEKILPELVSTAEGSKSVNYSGIIAFLINSVKELDARVKQLENK